MRLKIFILILCFFQVTLVKADQKISMDLQNVSIQDAIHILAKWMHLNVVVSPAIQGTTSLHLHDISANEAFDSLLSSHQLNKWKVNHVWFIGTRSEFIQKKQEDLKLQTILDETTPQVTRVWKIHYAKVDDVARMVQENKNSILTKRGYVQIDKRTNILYVFDIPERMQEINRLIQRVDIPVRQVLIESFLASVDSDYEEELGIQFSSAAGDMKDRFRIARLPKGLELDIQLSALEKEGHGEIISSPKLFTADHETASIEAGEEIPYQEISSSGATGVVFKKAVLSLKVTPQIMPGNQVLLQLQVNQDKPSKRIVLGVPAITTRQISTHVLVKNGQTIVLGGIYEMNKELDQQSVPVLGKIPLVGWFFRQQNVMNAKRELLIFVTPRVIV